MSSDAYSTTLEDTHVKVVAQRERDPTHRCSAHRGVPGDFERIERRYRGATSTSCRRADAAGSSHTSGGRPLGDDGPILRRSLCGLPALLARMPGTGPTPKASFECLARRYRRLAQRPRPEISAASLVASRWCCLPDQTPRADPRQRTGSMHLHRRCSVDGRALLVRSSSLRFEAFRGRQPTIRPRCRILPVISARPVRVDIVQGECQLLDMFRWSFPRRQQYRRLRRAAAIGAASVAACAFAVIVRGRRNRAGGCALAHDGRAANLRSSLVAPRRPQPCRRVV